MRDPKGVLDFGFFLTEDMIAPRHDILWHVAGDRGRAAFWRQAARVGTGVFQLQMSAGIDRMGITFARLKESTIEHRRSAMTNHPDKNAPPFIPGHDLSRTVSYLRAKVMQKAVWFYWLMDKGLRKRWGQILDYHRRGMVRGAPVRDVFGFAPESIARIKKEMGQWWAANRVKVATSGTVDDVMPNPNRLELVTRLGGIGRPKPQPAPIPAPTAARPARPTPQPSLTPQPTTRWVDVTGTTHRTTFDGYTTDRPIINGREAPFQQRRRVNDPSKLRNAPIPPKRRRAQ